ncbi:hypothetical protein HanRHA438_Chr13g0617731 [Helianthus annuus]|nr:hypothetical protein HanRHA438_Chr13g0617731 [Helianthus annuus]
MTGIAFNRTSVEHIRCWIWTTNQHYQLLSTFEFSESMRQSSGGTVQFVHDLRHNNVNNQRLSANDLYAKP